MKMKYFKVKYSDGTIEIKKSESYVTLIKDNEFYTNDHVNTRIFELSGEQLAIAISNEE